MSVACVRALSPLADRSRAASAMSCSISCSLKMEHCQVVAPTRLPSGRAGAEAPRHVLRSGHLLEDSREATPRSGSVSAGSGAEADGRWFQPSRHAATLHRDQWRLGCLRVLRLPTDVERGDRRQSGASPPHQDAGARRKLQRCRMIRRGKTSAPARAAVLQGAIPCGRAAVLESDASAPVRPRVGPSNPYPLRSSAPLTPSSTRVISSGLSEPSRFVSLPLSRVVT